MNQETEVNNNNSQFYLANISSGQDTFGSLETDKCKIYAVFDGHGGDSISKALANGNESHGSLLNILSKNLEEMVEGIDPVSTIKSSFVEMDKLLSKVYTGIVGSTATVAIQYQENLYIAYVGDGDAVVLEDDKLILKTLSHNTIDNSEEEERITSAGVSKTLANGFEVTSQTEAKIINGYYYNFLNRVVVDSLAMTRAFGHGSVKINLNTSKYREDCPLIAEPTVHKISLDSSKKIQVVMGSDGLWDVINKQNIETEIKDLIKLGVDSQRDISEVIGKFAEDRWKQTWNISHNDSVFEYTMTHKIQWDDIVVCYLEF